MSMVSGTRIVAALALASAGALGLAFTAQYGFDLQPCHLCYFQRLPYGGTLALALLALMPAVDAPSRRTVVVLCGVLFLLDACLALYHAGVEQKWWQGPTSCTGTAQSFSLGDLQAALTRRGAPMCDEIAFSFLGISMAGWNAIAAFLLTLGSFAAARQRAWWTP